MSVGRTPEPLAGLPMSSSFCNNCVSAALRYCTTLPEEQNAQLSMRDPTTSLPGLTVVQGFDVVGGAPFLDLWVNVYNGVYRTAECLVTAAQQA